MRYPFCLGRVRQVYRIATKYTVTWNEVLWWRRWVRARVWCCCQPYTEELVLLCAATLARMRRGIRCVHEVFSLGKGSRGSGPIHTTARLFDGVAIFRNPGTGENGKFCFSFHGCAGSLNCGRCHSVQATRTHGFTTATVPPPPRFPVSSALLPCGLFCVRLLVGYGVRQGRH